MTVRPVASPRAEHTEHVAANLLPRAALLVRLLVRQVHNEEMSRTEGEVLVILSESARRITELAELEGLAQPSMTALVRRLEARGWAEREAVEHDRRVAMVAITAAGRAAVERFRTEFLVAMRKDLASLSDAQLAALVSATDTLGELVGALQS